MSATTISEGHWTYRNAGWMSLWTATDTRTGQTHETGARHINDARAYTAALAPAEDTATAFEVTIASGPQRARAGHQRYTKAFAA
jgi:hypothetical protein